MRMKGSEGGEIVQVHGGHILRSTGRKDRHSKVYTAKGPRDRRVRLSAHTAIQFYDVQDRLGYDRPSKAVDWLMNKAKTAIDKLAELPPWDPNETSTDPIEKQSQSYEFQLNSQLGPSFLPQSIDSESIAETMKSFFPASSETQSMNFQSYPHEIMSRNTIQNEDLCLSLQSLQDPNAGNSHSTDQHQPLFSGSGFEANYQRMVGWNGGGDTESRDRYIYNSISMPQQQSLICHNSAFSQREPLQSSFTPSSFRAWDHHGIASTEHQNTELVHQSSMSIAQFVSEGSSSFQVPARIHGEEQLGLASAKPSSVPPPNSHH